MTARPSGETVPGMLGAWVVGSAARYGLCVGVWVWGSCGGDGPIMMQGDGRPSWDAGQGGAGKAQGRPPDAPSCAHACTCARPLAPTKPMGVGGFRVGQAKSFF